MLVVSLYTVRLLLNILGVIDYGIYNVVGSIVSMFSFISYSLSNVTQRYFSYEIGRGDREKLRQIFHSALFIFSVLAVLIYIIIEIIGYWFLTHKLVIPIDRLDSAKWVFHFSLLSLLITILTSPFNAMIIAKERMEAFAMISFLEAVLKLMAVYLLTKISADHLKVYSVFIFLNTFLISFAYFLYCKINFSECIIRFFIDKKIIKSILIFAGWNFFGSLAAVVNSQGINIIINMFFGPAINAARGIAYQANALINQFVLNFSIALNPQITKLYAAKEFENFRKMVFSGSKFAFFLVFIIVTPMLFETQFILELWLTNIPHLTIIFFQLIIVNVLIDSLSIPFQAAVQASGKIKIYQIVVGSLLLFNLPLSYLFFRAGYPPQTCFLVSIGISVLSFVARSFFIQQQLKMSIKIYLKEVILKIMLVVLLIYPFLWVLKVKVFGNQLSSINSIYFIFVSIVISVLIIYLLGFSTNEKKLMKHFFLIIIKKREK